VSDFLANLAARCGGSAQVVRPRLPSLFEPARLGLRRVSEFADPLRAQARPEEDQDGRETEAAADSGALRRSFTERPVREMRSDAPDRRGSAVLRRASPSFEAAPAITGMQEGAWVAQDPTSAAGTPLKGPPDEATAGVVRMVPPPLSSRPEGPASVVAAAASTLTRETGTGLRRDDPPPRASFTIDADASGPLPGRGRRTPSSRSFSDPEEPQPFVIEVSSKRSSTSEIGLRASDLAPEPVPVIEPRVRAAPEHAPAATGLPVTFRSPTWSPQPPARPSGASRFEGGRSSAWEGRARDEPTIQVTIGRVEVRAARQEAASSRKERPTPPVMGLDEYLRRRGRGAGR
jgi:hypothetical protein